MFATDSSIRYLAPPTPPGTTVRFSYTVVNTDLLSDTRTVTVSVTAGGSGRQLGAAGAGTGDGTGVLRALDAPFRCRWTGWIPTATG